jgi:hypothetical protein
MPREIMVFKKEDFPFLEGLTPEAIAEHLKWANGLSPLERRRFAEGPKDGGRQWREPPIEVIAQRPRSL